MKYFALNFSHLVYIQLLASEDDLLDCLSFRLDHACIAKRRIYNFTTSSCSRVILSYITFTGLYTGSKLLHTQTRKGDISVCREKYWSLAGIIRISLKNSHSFASSPAHRRTSERQFGIDFWLDWGVKKLMFRYSPQRAVVELFLSLSS